MYVELRSDSGEINYSYSFQNAFNINNINSDETGIKAIRVEKNQEMVKVIRRKRC